MKLKKVSMKRLLTALIVLIALAVIAGACHRSKGGGGPGPGGPGPEPPITIPETPVTFTSPEQAASQVAAALNARALADAQFEVAVALGMGTRPGGFAPSLTGDIGKIDPDLKMMVERMAKFARSPIIQRAVKKAAALKAMRATSVNETLTVGFCDNADGRIQISGTNNYDEVDNPSVTSSYDIVFTTCRDDVLASELDGRIHIEESESTDNNVVAASLTAQNLAESLFEDETFAVLTERTALTGAFSDSDLLTPGTTSASGAFAVTTAARGGSPETIVDHTFDVLTNTRTATSDATSTTDANTVNGTFTLGRFVGGAEVFKMTMAIDNLVDSVQTITAGGNRIQTIDGTIGMAWAPEKAGCIAGQMTIATTTPRAFAPGGTCPSEGVMTINNAIITFGTPIQVTMTNSTTSQTFADCAAMDATGAACLSN